MTRYFISFLLLLLMIADDVYAEKYWIFFTDKGSGKINDVRIIVKSLQRRKKLGVDRTWYDIPVHQGYINQLLDAGITIHHHSKWLNAVSVTVDAQMLNMLNEFPFVEHVEPVKVYRKSFPEQDEMHAPRNISQSRSYDYGYAQEQIEQINCHTAHDSGFIGQGVRVLILDTGFNINRTVFDSLTIIDEWDFVNNDANTANETLEEENYGQHNHGTYIFSAMAGYDPGNLIGPAFGSEFLLAKTENVATETQVEEDNYVAALEWGEENGADVASSSLGYLDWYSYCDMDGNTAITTRAVDIAVSLGMFCVTAAGNWGGGEPPVDPCDTLTYYISAPADADSVISVGAVNNSGEIAYFSSHGPSYDGRIKPEVCARGVSTWCVNANDDSYRTASGTSLSTPLVGGAVAVILSAHPDWTPMEVREALLMTADQATSPDNEYGYGIINVMSAIQYEDESAIVHDNPQTFSILHVFPNPFNPSTTIRFSVLTMDATIIRIFDINGRLLDEPVNGFFSLGEHEIVWNPKEISSGIYFIQYLSSNHRFVQKISFLK